MKVRRIYFTKESVLEGIRESDDGILDYLYKEHYPMIRNLVLTNNGSIEDAEDIMQEGIIAFYEKAKDRNFVLTCEVKTFLYSVCRNLWLKMLKRNSSNVKFEDILHQDVVDVGEDNEEVLTQKQMILTELINTIGEKCKEILMLFYYEKISMEDIAVKLGYTNADNAKNQKYKCFKKLQTVAVSQFKK